MHQRQRTVATRSTDSNHPASSSRERRRLAVRILARDEKGLWCVFGAVAGLGLMNKLSVGFLALGLVVGLLLTTQRSQLASPCGRCLGRAVSRPKLDTPVTLLR